jgi:MarC family membrane protein
MGDIFGLTVTLFAVLNPLAVLPLFVAVLAPYDQARQKKIITRELLIAYITIVLFIFFGKFILSQIGISMPAIRMGGGFLLVLISLGMIFSKEESMEAKTSVAREPFIVPLAIPALAGPACMATGMILADQAGAFITLAAFTIAWAIGFVILYSASFLKRVLGEKGLLAAEKLGGMLICLIGANMIISGVFVAIKENAAMLAS